MNPFQVFTLLIFSTLLYEAQGMNRKFMTKTISSSTYNTSATTMTSKNPKSDENKKDTKSSQESLDINLSSKHLKFGKTKATPPSYPDVVDLTGMDYSPARRKPPIHN